MLMSCLTSRGQVGQQTSAPAFPLAKMAVIASFKLQVLDWFYLVVCNSKNWVGPFLKHNIFVFRATAKAVMRRRHEDDGQDDLASGALTHHRHLGCRGPHGRGQLCQVLPSAAGGGWDL